MQRNIIRGLIKPRRVELEKGVANYGKFVVEPLERGYGTTIGNSLRRILLSSLPGAAITRVTFDGVKHEFSTIPGVIEDVTEIILNLKDVILQISDKDAVELRIDAVGPCEVTAAMITGPADMVVVNPDLHIASLNADGKLSAALIAEAGRGYVISDNNKLEEMPVGTIAIDSIFSPVRKVNHYVTNARVGQRTDYDKLTLEVWTDGSVNPEEAIQGAAYILRDQLAVFTGGEEIVEEVVAEVSERKPKFNENLFRRIEELEFSVRSSNCLENADIKFIGELVQRSEAEMLRTKNFGRKSLNEIKEILGEMGLGLGMRLDGFPPRSELEKLAEETSGAFA
ncbi:MAG: DNA-directed RNA polymerase subunit alpha [bacterium]|nr:DNA-directed RNA polymerase subunit alpha [bacterium]